MTPLVAWGAGIQKAKLTKVMTPQQDYTLRWDLNSVLRRDVNQADITPLISALVGTPFSMNSVGVLPVEYLDTSDAYKAEALFANALQIIEQLRVKEKHKLESTLPMMARPYSELTSSQEAVKIHRVRSLIADREYALAIESSRELIELALSGLSYYQTYDR